MAEENKAQATLAQRAADAKAQRQAAEAKGADSPQDANADEMPKSAAERVSAMDDPTDGFAPEVLDPYPAYESMGLDELRTLAEDRAGDLVNHAALRSHLVFRLRQAEHSPAYDHMTMDQLETKANELDVKPDEEYLKAHYVSTLRAADTMGR